MRRWWWEIKGIARFWDKQTQCRTNVNFLDACRLEKGIKRHARVGLLTNSSLVPFNIYTH